MKTFKKIFVVDLHGNSNIVETPPFGEVNKNIFDIQQGVSIIIAIKKKRKSQELAEVCRASFWGTRKQKQAELWNGSIKSIKWKPVELNTPNFVFLNRDWGKLEKYEEGVSLKYLFPIQSTGAQSGNESIFLAESLEKLKQKFPEKLQQEKHEFLKYLHKPFDFRFFTFFPSPTNGMKLKLIPSSYRARPSVSHHMRHENISVLFSRSNKGAHVDNIFVSDCLIDVKCPERSTGGIFAPLYLYPDEQDLDQSRRVNMDEKIRAKIEAAAMGFPPPRGEGLREGGLHIEREGGTHEKNEANNNSQTSPTGSVQASLDQSPTSPLRAESASSTRGGGKELRKPDELAIFDYIYGVLHCPAYRETYKEFLKIDFPRIPYPSSPEKFWDIVAKGNQLRTLHLMEESAIGQTPYPFEGEGEPMVDKITFEETDELATKETTGAVFINKTHSFTNVPRIAWEFYIGGYQPAQKWLKDRKGRELSFDDVRHYQKIIKILSETDRIMKTIIMDL